METNEELIRAWIGEKNEKWYDKLMKNWSFSWLAFFFRGLQFAGRKMYLYGIIFYIIDIILYSFVKIIPLNILFALISGFSFFPLYRHHIMKKIKKYENLSYEEQIEKAKLYGGNKLSIATIGILLVMILGLILPAMITGANRTLKKINNGRTFQETVAVEDNSKQTTNIKMWNITEETENGTFYCSLEYDDSKWNKGNSGGYTALGYSGTNDYISYGGANISDKLKGVIEILESEETRNIIIENLKNEINSNGFEVKDVNSSKLDGNTYQIIIDCNKDSANVKFYFYYVDEKMVIFMTTNYDNNFKFDNDANKVMKSIIVL